MCFFIPSQSVPCFETSCNYVFVCYFLSLVLHKLIGPPTCEYFQIPLSFLLARFSRMEGENIDLVWGFCEFCPSKTVQLRAFEWSWSLEWWNIHAIWYLCRSARYTGSCPPGLLFTRKYSVILMRSYHVKQSTFDY